MRIQVICLLLVLLAASVLSLDENLNPQYEKFKKQHIDKEMKAKDCTRVMSEEEIYVTKKKRKLCKPRNTFILADESEVKSVCQNGTPQGNRIKSSEKFNLVVCNLTNNKTKYPNCSYKGKKLYKKKIIILCKKGYPVHYDGDITYV